MSGDETARRAPDPARTDQLRSALEALDEAQQELEDARREEHRPGTGNERAARRAVTTMRERLWSRARTGALERLDDPSWFSSRSHPTDGLALIDLHPDPDAAARRFDAATRVERPDDPGAPGELIDAAWAWADALCAAGPSPSATLPGRPARRASR